MPIWVTSNTRLDTLAAFRPMKLPFAAYLSSESHHMLARKLTFQALALLFAFTLHGIAQSQPARYDLVLKGGHVIDPANRIDGVMDVAVSKNKIAAVQKDIPSTDAGKVVDVSGLYVTPGLIDIHFHIGHGGAPLNWFAPDNGIEDKNGPFFK